MHKCRGFHGARNLVKITRFMFMAERGKLRKGIDLIDFLQKSIIFKTLPAQEFWFHDSNAHKSQEVDDLGL